jgi:hypothetical protein
MPKRSSKAKPPTLRDVNTNAKSILTAATEGAATDKNPAAVALGRLGGQKGGAARAAALTQSQRTAIAKKAARAIWSKT